MEKKRKDRLWIVHSCPQWVINSQVIFELNTTTDNGDQQDSHKSCLINIIPDTCGNPKTNAAKTFGLLLSDNK